MTELKFACTGCGHCCTNASLPLTVKEAIAWQEDHGKVVILCEADPWPTEPSALDLRAAHRKRRSFPAISGSSQVRVTAILVGVVSGACKNLTEDLRCSIYERRPLVCRIYPAEISPFIQLNTANKGCPPEAWTSGDVILRDGSLVDPNLQQLIEQSRQTDQDDSPRKSLVCHHLGINLTALAGQGFMQHDPDQTELLACLRKAREAELSPSSMPTPWRVYSPESETVDKLRAQGISLAPKQSGNNPSFLWSQARPKAA